MVASFSKTNTLELVTYTSDDSEALPGAIQLPRYWAKYGRIHKSCNGYAALKIDAIKAEFDKGIEEVIYLDGADVLVLEDLNKLFHECRGAEIGAHSWMENYELTHADKEVKKAFGEYIEPKEGDLYVNNGVIYMKRSPLNHMFLLAWKALVQNPGRRVTHSPKQLGDQLDFNLALRAVSRNWRQLIYDIPAEWNCRGHHSKAMRISGGKVVNEAGFPVKIAHASGVGNYFSQEILDHVLGGAKNE
jgi:hypothetical protein